MALTITQLNEFTDYFNKVMDKGLHHAPNIIDAILTIAGAVVLKATDIKVLERDGDTKNVMWFYIGNNRYALSYVHDDGGRIELRENSIQGAPRFSFNNDSTTRSIREAFNTLN